MPWRPMCRLHLQRPVRRPRYERPAVPWSQHPASEVPEGYYTVPLGKAAKIRAGEAVTVLCYGTMVHVVRAAAAESGIDAEMLDLRTLVPLTCRRSSIR